MQPPTFPCRPINCGKLTIARPKIGNFWVEPKITGMRVVLHVPTGEMWTRHGTALASPKWFAAAAAKIKQLLPNEEWLDCEGLYQAHNVGKGTMVVLDSIVKGECIEDRRKRFSVLPEMPITNDLAINEVYRIPSLDWGGAKDLWDRLLKLGEDWVKRGNGSVPLFEGVVAKKKNSGYAFQNVDPKRETPVWQKHRFA
jgi:ATP-dependent DNA ligase